MSNRLIICLKWLHDSLILTCSTACRPLHSSYQLTICHWHHSKGLVTSLHSHNYYKTKTKFPYISVLPLVFFCLFVFAVCFVFNFSHLPGTSELFSRTSQDITYTCFMCLGVLCICCRDCYRDVHYVCWFRNC